MSDKCRDTLEKLDSLLREAGLHWCFCLVCKHQSGYGPCGACGCRNEPATERPAPHGKEERGNEQNQSLHLPELRSRLLRFVCV